MTIQVHRKTGWVGMFGNIQLLVNGEKNKKISNNETIDMYLPEEDATIQASTFGMKSNPIEVKDGDQLLLKSTFWGLYGFTFMIILVLINPFIQNMFLSGFSLFYAIIMFITVFIPGMHQRLEKTGF